jgi:hypothetical protein
MRIEIHGTFQISGATTPLPAATRRKIHATVAALLQATMPDVQLARVIVSEAFDDTGAYCRQCELSVQTTAGPKLEHAGASRTIAGALDDACARLVRQNTEMRRARRRASRSRKAPKSNARSTTSC